MHSDREEAISETSLTWLTFPILQNEASILKER